MRLKSHSRPRARRTTRRRSTWSTAFPIIGLAPSHLAPAVAVTSGCPPRAPRRLTPRRRTNTTGRHQTNMVA